MLAAIRQWVIKTMMKGQTGVVQSLPKREIIEMNTQITAERIMRNGINPNDLKTVGQVENVVNQIDQPKVISADSAEGRGITEQLLGKKKADVMDMEGNKIPEGSKIMGGKEVKPIDELQNYTKSKEEIVQDLVDQKFGKGYFDNVDGSEAAIKDAAIKARLDAGNKKGIETIKINLVDDSIAKIKSLEPMDAMKEANLVAGKKGRYANLDDNQVKKIMDDTNDHIFQDADPIEDFETGGRVGLKGGAFLKFLKKFKVKQSGDDVKEFLSKRKFMKDLVGNTEKAKKARELRMLKEAADEARRNPGFKFENVDIEKDIKPIFDRGLVEALKKNRKLNADGGRIGLKGGGQDAGESNFKSTNTNSPGHPSNRTISPSTNKATVGPGGGDSNNKPPRVVTRTGDGGITDIKLKKPTRFNEPNTTKFQKFLNFLGKETGYTQHNIDNQKLRNALDDEEITEEQYKRMGGFDVAKNMPQDLGLGYGDVGLASAGYNAIKSIGNLFNAPGSEYGDIGPLESIKLNTQGAAGLGKKDQMMYDDIVGGKKFFSNENEMYNMADGGRIGYKAGSVDKMRRLILKAMGAGTVGIGAAKSGIFSFGKGATKQVAKEVAQQTTSSMPPPYFFKLAEKIKKMGDDVTAKSATKDREVVTKFKEYELTEDVATGEMTIQRMKIDDNLKYDASEFYGKPVTEDVYMNYKPGKGQADETTGRVADEYTEDTSLIRSDKPAEGGIEKTFDGVPDDILEEVGEAKSIKYASGGLAYMLGE